MQFTSASETCGRVTEIAVRLRFGQAAIRIETTNPTIRQQGLGSLSRAGQEGVKRLMSNEVTADFLLLKQVLMFAINTGGVIGHGGLIEDDNYDRLIALEGRSIFPEIERWWECSDVLVARSLTPTKLHEPRLSA